MSTPAPPPGPPPSGPTNSLVDVAGLRVGHHQRVGDGWLTGATVVLPGPEGAVAGVDVRGGGPGTRETDLLDPRTVVERVHAVCLAGGSAFGLAAADGVMRRLYDAGTGFPMGGPGEVVPIVPAAVLYDLGRGGDFAARPDASFGEAAVDAAMGPGLSAGVAEGVVGAGTGAQAGGLKGGVGTVSAVLADGTTVAALVAVNAIGSTVDPATGELWGAPHLHEGDLHRPGGPADPVLRRPDPAELAASLREAERLVTETGQPRTLATTIGVIATDATLTKAQCAKLASVGHDGLARAVRPVHSMLDGDTLFALSTTARPAPDLEAFYALLDEAACCVTRAVVRAMLAAETVSTPAGTWRSYRDVFPSAVGPGAGPT